MVRGEMPSTRPQDGETVLVPDAHVDQGDIGRTPLGGEQEAGGVGRERGLEALEPEQNAQRFAGCCIGVENMNEPIAVQE